jgi:chromosome partitioning protein
MRRNTTIILCTNDKGGIGKTTLAVHVTGVLHKQRLGQILLVDCDPRPDAWKFFKGRRPSSGEYRRSVDSRLDILWNPPRLHPPKFEPIKQSDLQVYDYIVIDTDSPPEDTVAMIRNNLPDIILVPINKPQEWSMDDDLPVFLDTAADIEKRANLEPDSDYYPQFIVVPLGIVAEDVITVVDKCLEKPQNCQVASAMRNLQDQIGKSLKLKKFIWDYPDCEDTFDYFIDILNLAI